MMAPDVNDLSVPNQFECHLINVKTWGSKYALDDQEMVNDIPSNSR